MESKKKLSVGIIQCTILILALVIQINLINAVVIETGTTFNNTITGTNITCLNTYYADSITVHNNVTGITFSQFNRDNSLTNHITFTVNETNKNYLCSDLPYINSTTDTQVVIKSNVDTFNTKVSFSIPSRDIGSISTSNSQTFLIPNGQSSPLSLTDLITSDGDTTLTLNYDAPIIDTCNNYFDAGSSGLSFIVLLIIVSSAGIILFFIFGGDEVDMVSIAIIIIVVSIVLVLGMIIINSMSNC